MGFADERRHQRDGEKRDEPRCIDHQPRGKARHCYGILRLAEELADQAAAPGRLPARALELVLQLAVFEILEVERCGVLHQPKARLVAGTAPEQSAVEQGNGAAQNIGQNREAELQRQQRADAMERSACQPLCQVIGGKRRAGEANDFVDDELADIKRRHRKLSARTTRSNA